MCHYWEKFDFNISFTVDELNVNWSGRILDSARGGGGVTPYILYGTDVPLE